MSWPSTESHRCEITLLHDAQEFTNVPRGRRPPEPGEFSPPGYSLTMAGSNLLRYDLNRIPRRFKASEVRKYAAVLTDLIEADSVQHGKSTFPVKESTKLALGPESPHEISRGEKGQARSSLLKPLIYL